MSAGNRPTPITSPTGSTADGIAANCSTRGSRDLDGSAAGGVATRQRAGEVAMGRVAADGVSVSRQAALLF